MTTDQSSSDEQDCCSVTCDIPGPEDTAVTGASPPRECPRCGQVGITVDEVTLRALVKWPEQSRLQETDYRFCATADCVVVYFSQSADGVFTTDDITVRVREKVQTDGHPLPVCYCFNYTDDMIAQELAKTGETTIPLKITSEVRAGNCRCEYTNPKGACCLGDVNAVVTQLVGEMGTVELI